MKTFSNKAKTIRSIIAITISYMLIVIKTNFLPDTIYALICDLIISFFFITTPIAIVAFIYQIKYRHLLLGIPLIFLLVLIYSPEGLYFIIYKGPFFLAPAEADWKYGIAISIMFFFLHFFAAFIGKSLSKIVAKTQKMTKQNLQEKSLSLENPSKKIDQTILQRYYSDLTKTVSAIISIIISYFLMLAYCWYINQRLAQLPDTTFYSNIHAGYGITLLCITLPLLSAWYIFRFKYHCIFLSIPIIFLLVIISSPSYLYFIIPNFCRSWLEYPASNIWAYATIISIMFFLLQSFTFFLASLVSLLLKEKAKGTDTSVKSKI